MGRQRLALYSTAGAIPLAVVPAFSAQDGIGRSHPAIPAPARDADRAWLHWKRARTLARLQQTYDP